eukprot:scaffold120299_cov62-Phaeocystis_antarctica.AAC.3
MLRHKVNLTHRLTTAELSPLQSYNLSNRTQHPTTHSVSRTSHVAPRAPARSPGPQTASRIAGVSRTRSRSRSAVSASPPES